MDEAARTLHPCWEAYRLADEYVLCFFFFYLIISNTYYKIGFVLSFCVDRREPVVYLNSFSGDATTEFPSTLQMSRGGVCF